MKIAIDYLGDLSTRCIHEDSGEQLFTDAPKDNQGQGKRFSPTDLLAAALGSCVITLMGIQARRLNVPLTHLEASVTKEMTLAPPRRIGKITLTLTSSHTYSAEVTQKLEAAGRGCPVAESLHPNIEVVYHFQWGEAQ